MQGNIQSPDREWTVNLLIILQPPLSLNINDILGYDQTTIERIKAKTNTIIKYKKETNVFIFFIFHQTVQIWGTESNTEKAIDELDLIVFKIASVIYNKYFLEHSRQH